MDGFEAGRYALYRVKAGLYNIYTTSDEHGIVCVGTITRREWEFYPWTLEIDGKRICSYSLLKRAKKAASRHLDSPYRGLGVA